MPAPALKDPLEQFRARPPASAALTPGAATPGTVAESAGYIAFGTKDRVARLRIRSARNPTRAPAYQYLLDVVYDGDFGTSVILVFTFMVVTVTGKNLQDVVMALENGSADFIQEFHSGLWPWPQDESAPFIESIEIVVTSSAEGMARTETVPAA